MKIDLFITTEVFDRDGKLRYKRRRRSKSFVKAFLAILIAQINGAVDVTGIADITGTDRTIADHANSFAAYAAAGQDELGIVVGTGSTAVNASDNKLATQVAHGVTAGKLSHSAVVFTTLAVSDPNVSFTMYRDFTNLTVASITINEEGLYVLGHDGTDEEFCAIRDVETTGVAVAAGENLRVTYTLQTST